MSTFIQKLSVLGVKNIESKIEIVFSPQDLSIGDYKDNNVKAIYGPNGSGKTAIIHAFQIFSKIFTNKSYLHQKRNESFLREIMNKKTNKISIGIQFVVYDNEKINGNYSYDVELMCDNNDIHIKSEIFYDLLKSNKKPIISTENGSIITSPLGDELNSKFQNLLNKQFYFDILTQIILNDKSNILLKEYENSDILKLTYHFLEAFGNDVMINMDSKDDHMGKIDGTKYTFEEVKRILSEYPQLIEEIGKSGYSAKIVSEKQLVAIQRENPKKTRFIKMFKPEIKQIIIDSKLRQENQKKKEYILNELIDYGYCKIDLEFESVGIKKILSLYQALKHVSNGGVLVIDELDSHINDVYLVDIVKYVMGFTNGQLIFTTHNLSPMDELKKRKTGIDFMSSSSVITSWVQVGNYSPSSLYKKGMIKGLPFNLIPEDFMSIFYE